MTLLTYTLLTDPAPLVASAAGQPPSTGTVYLLVTNTGKPGYFKVTVTVPVGTGTGHLTPNATTIKSTAEYNDAASGGTRAVVVQAQGPAFQITDQGGSRIHLGSGDYLVLTLANISVTPQAGLAVLRVTEAASTSKVGGVGNSHTAVALVKSASKETSPRNFHSDKAMVKAGENLTLSWDDGSPGLSYEILFPGGTTPVSGGTWSPPAPDRATTYTLVATDPSTKQKHFLTTTVQVSNPTLEALTVTNGIDTPQVQGTGYAKGRLAFTAAGADIYNNSSALGTVSAEKASFDGVNTRWVQGRSTGDGWIGFTGQGLNVYRSGTQEWGTVFADKADLNGVNTRWVQGRSTDDGWFNFTKFGIHVSRGGTDTPKQGVVYTEFVYAEESGSYGHINLHQDGITVYASNGRDGIGSMTAHMNPQ